MGPGNFGLGLFGDAGCDEENGEVEHRPTKKPRTDVVDPPLPVVVEPQPPVVVERQSPVRVVGRQVQPRGSVALECAPPVAIARLCVKGSVAAEMRDLGYDV